jgi:L-threonylcarbamoyladenylate synthase
MIEKIFWQDMRSQILIVQSLQSGNIVLATSDTVLGLLSDTTQQGVLLLNEIKGRQNKPYIILIESSLKALHFVSENDVKKYQKLLDACWPGPLTLIFKAKEGLPSYLQGTDGTVALRVPYHEGLLSILKNFKGLFSTSANKAGEPVPHELAQITPDFLTRIPFVVLDKQAATSTQIIPSTILDLTGQKARVVRQGAFAQSELERILGVNL